jgi:uncharacterized protein YecT (DUF1311 family)
MASLVSFLAGPAHGFEMKKANEFNTLRQFESVDSFSDYIAQYEQSCIDVYGGASIGAACFVEYELWDKELNIAYSELRRILEPKGKELLLQSQRSWLKMRDSSLEINSYVLDQSYANMQGTMWNVVRADSSSGMAAEIVRERTLLLWNWYEILVSDDEF